MSEHGFTNDSREYERVIAWRDAAIADGWEHGSQSSEAEERWSKLTRDGFVCQVLTRSRGNEVLDPARGYHQSVHGKYAYQAKVSLWGPDGVAVNPGLIYDWDAIRESLRACPECGAKDVETFRVAFANRACAKCRPALEAKLCKPGWCD